MVGGPMIPLLQMESLVITAIVFVLSAVLTAFMAGSYARGRKRGPLFWMLGLVAFTVGVLMEILFALGISPIALADAYLFVVALLVELLALGSMQLVRSKWKRTAYYWFCIASTAYLAYALAAYGGVGIVKDYVALLPPSLPVIVASSVITFPASALLVAIAAYSYRKTRNARMLSIMAGVAVVVVAGTLYIAAFPSLLYISEFIGIVLLWLGFYQRQG